MSDFRPTEQPFPAGIASGRHLGKPGIADGPLRGALPRRALGLSTRGLEAPPSAKPRSEGLTPGERFAKGDHNPFDEPANPCDIGLQRCQNLR